MSCEGRKVRVSARALPTPRTKSLGAIASVEVSESFAFVRRRVLVTEHDRRANRVRRSDSEHQLNACLRDKVKLRRAHGGCLGNERRRRTWTAAKSSGEPLTGFDPGISEWDNPRRDYLPAGGEYIAAAQRTRGTETSKYPEEKKATAIPPVVASERGTA